MSVVLFLPNHHFRLVNNDTALKWGVIQAKALADYGHVVYLVLPNEKDGFKYEGKLVENKNIKVVYLSMVKDQMTGTQVFSKELLRLLIVRGTRIPFEVVVNNNPALAVGIQRPLVECGWSRLKIPVFTISEMIASYDEWRRQPCGDREWQKPLQLLESGAALFQSVSTGNPYDYGILKQNIRRIFSPAVAREAHKNTHFIWWPVNPLFKPYLHKKPRKGETFKVLIAGGFGRGVEERGEQAVVTIGAIKKLASLFNNRVKLIVCTNTPQGEEHKEMLEGTSAFVEVYWGLPNKEFREKVGECHVSIHLRPYDGVNMSLVEQMMRGIPIIWWRTKYQKGWINEEKMPYVVERCNAENVATVLLSLIKTYNKAAELAYEWALQVERRHSMECFASKVTDVLDGLLLDARESFDNSEFSSVSGIFEKLPKKDILFEDAFKFLNNAGKAKVFGFYSRVWFLNMCRRFGYSEFMKDGELYVKYRNGENEKVV